MAAEHLERTLKVSERKVCKVLDLARSTKRRIYKKTDEMLIDELHVLSYKHQTLVTVRFTPNCKSRTLKLVEKRFVYLGENMVCSYQ